MFISCNTERSETTSQRKLFHANAAHDEGGWQYSIFGEGGLYSEFYGDPNIITHTKTHIWSP